MTAKKPSLDPVVRRFIEEAGSTTQAFGLGRVTGQVYACLYFSPTPKNLNDLQEILGISKGSASTIVRQLEQWHAVRKIWIRGDRKDYYTAEDNFGHILKRVLNDTVSNKMNSYNALLQELEDKLPDSNADNGRTREQHEFIVERFNKLRHFHGRARKVWENPLLRKLLQ